MKKAILVISGLTALLTSSMACAGYTDGLYVEFENRSTSPVFAQVSFTANGMGDQSIASFLEDKGQYTKMSRNMCAKYFTQFKDKSDPVNSSLTGLLPIIHPKHSSSAYNSRKNLNGSLDFNAMSGLNSSIDSSCKNIASRTIEELLEQPQAIRIVYNQNYTCSIENLDPSKDIPDSSSCSNV